jgi:two-component system response regulator VicR
VNAQTIMVCSGKGGTGKSTIAVLVGAHLAALNKKVLLIELDSGLRSVDIIAGVYGKTVYDIEDVLCGRCDGEKAVVQSPLYPGLSVISAPYEGGIVRPAPLARLVTLMSPYFDFILLDVMLPKIDGITVCQRIREHSNVPIIMLTAKGEQIDKILGLEYGADDYMTKPFNILEVKARIKTIMRRASGNVQNEARKVVRVHDMEINAINRSVTLGGKEVRLTAKEFDLLQVFVNNRGKVFSREALLETVWKYDYTGDARTVDVHIRRLREKIERNPAQPEFIFTKWGVGYYFTDKD